jgi:soluble lytic murein transglycosylase
MSRRLVASLACLCLSALSCDVHLSAPAALPHVSAPPPQNAHAPAAPSAEAVAIRAYLATRRTGLSEFELDALAQTIAVEAERHAFDAELVMAVMYVESRFRNFSVSPVGALGLMQILPSTGEELAERYGVPWRGAQTLFDPHVNVRLGIAYLRELTDRYGDVSTALAAYNWGPGHIDRRLQRGRALPTVYPALVLDAHSSGQRAGRSS